MIDYDENGNAIVNGIKRPDLQQKVTKEELLSIVDEQINRINELPNAAMFIPVTHADMVSMLYIMKAILNL